jgi:hypothetical protein
MACVIRLAAARTVLPSASGVVNVFGLDGSGEMLPRLA